MRACAILTARAGRTQINKVLRMRRITLGWLIVAGTLVGLAASCRWAPLEPVAATVETDTADAQVTVVRSAARTLVEIHSPSGIGRSRITLQETIPPGPVEFRLHLAGLEHFSLAYDGTVITLSMAQSRHAPLITVQNAREPETPGTPGTPFWLGVHPPATGRADPVYRVVVSPRLPGQQPQELELRWVDFYR